MSSRKGRARRAAAARVELRAWEMEALLNTQPRSWPARPVDGAAAHKWATTRPVLFPACRGKLEPDFSRAWSDPGGTMFGAGPYLKVPHWHVDDPRGEGYERWMRVFCPLGYPGDRLEARASSGRRALLEVASVRLRRLHDMGGRDAEAEGIAAPLCDWLVDWFRGRWDRAWARRGHGWAANPWVWVVEHRRLR